MDMPPFQKTTHLSEILEKSETHPVIIFKYSSECRSSDRVAVELEKLLAHKPHTPIYKITVQTEPALSKKVEEHFGIQHESPQVLVIHKGKVTYSADHNEISVENFNLR